MMPVLFSAGPLHLYSFGVCTAAGVLLSLFLMRRASSAAGMPAGDFVLDLVMITVASGFAGARLFYIFENFSWYQEHPWTVFSVWEGGLIFYGGVWASLLAVIFFLKCRRISPWAGLDFIIPYVALTHAFGRLGCFLNGCCWGRVCELPWAVTFPGEIHPRHPAQLYEAVLDLLLFFFLRRVFLRKKFSGQIILLYLGLYGVIRFGMEMVREGHSLWAGLTHNQWTSLLLMVGTIFLYRRRKRAES